MFKIDYYIFKYFLTSKIAVLTKICLMVIHFFTAYFKRRITSSASDSHTVLHTLWVKHGADQGVSIFNETYKLTLNYSKI
jgi:hypothetical protein